MEIIRSIIDSKRCVGCGACRNICPTKAISMGLNQDGFYQPEINFDMCINCGLCDKACPAANVRYENEKQPECYALMANDDVRERSASGGAFELLADYVFDKGGKVCGVAFNSDFMSTKHIIIDSKSDLDKLHGSKYIMSDTGDVYSQIKNLINSGTYVLFTGCPCQVAGLYGYLGKLKDSPYLLTADLVCHGIPSLKAFARYMRDVHGNKKISNLGFRDKEYGWNSTMTIDFANEGRFHMSATDDYYWKAFLRNLSKNAACGNCVFARIPRQADITIGDFWGIANYNETYNDDKGTSVVLLNNKRGKALSYYLKNSAKLFEPVPLDIAIKGNANLVKSPPVRVARSQFFKKLDDLRFPALVDWAISSERYDIGLVGIPMIHNFGGALTYYGLYRALRDLDYSVAVFSWPRNAGIKPIPPEDIYTVNPYDAGALHLDYPDKQAMSAANELCDTFLVGSDQLFNADLYKKYGEIVTLDWVSDNHRKIAYAASFGHDYFWGTENLRAKMAHDMQKFDAFSVREENGVALAQRTFGVDAEWVLDPVFLCDKKHYEELAVQSTKKKSKKHIFGYILDPAVEKDDIIDLCMNSLGLPVELYTDMVYMTKAKKMHEMDKKFKHKLMRGNVNDWLNSLISSDFVIADSFHGVCFAIIFNKPFIAILNQLRGSLRFYSILGKFGLTDRLVSSVDEIKSKQYLLDKKLDYTVPNRILAEERLRCTKWLKSALSPETLVKKPMSSDDIVDEKLRAINLSIQKNNIIANGLMVNRKLYNISDIYTYLEKLAACAHDSIISLSVKDTPGFCINEEIDQLLHNLGLKESLVNKHWHSYEAVINNQQVISEIISINDERVAYEGTVDGVAIKNVSRSYKKGNVSVIQINGIDYSENRRGINIVVFDKRLGKVIDSVCFDTHDPDLKCYRFGTKSIVNIVNEDNKGTAELSLIECYNILDRLAINKQIYSITDFYSYLEHLNIHKQEYISIFSVKDTPGFCFNERMSQLFKQLGLSATLVNKHWHSYEAILNADNVVSEIISAGEEAVLYEGIVDGFNIKNVSKALNCGNISEIIINGTDYSQNMRGINIVLIDKQIGKVADSVCFDTHDPDLKCYRA